MLWCNIVIAKEIRTRFGFYIDLPSSFIAIQDQNLGDILKEYEIGGFVLGLPISLDNSENKQSQLVRDFNINLRTFFKKPSALWDERFSSDVIFKEMRKADLSKTKIKSKLDQQSAAYILQGYLDRYRNN